MPSVRKSAIIGQIRSIEFPLLGFDTRTDTQSFLCRTSHSVIESVFP
jgi:hypothetical protein